MSRTNGETTETIASLLYEEVLDAPQRAAILALLNAPSLDVNNTWTGLNDYSAAATFTYHATAGLALRTALTISDPIIVVLSGPLITDSATTGQKVSYRVTKAFTIEAGDVSFDCVTAPTGSSALADIEKNGVSIYSARPQIESGEISSSTGVVGTLTGSPMSFAVGDIIGIFIDQIGSSTAGAGYTLSLNTKY